MLILSKSCISNLYELGQQLCLLYWAWFHTKPEYLVFDSHNIQTNAFSIHEMSLFGKLRQQNMQKWTALSAQKSVKVYVLPPVPDIECNRRLQKHINRSHADAQSSDPAVFFESFCLEVKNATREDHVAIFVYSRNKTLYRKSHIQGQPTIVHPSDHQHDLCIYQFGS